MARSLSPKHASDKDLALYALHREDVNAGAASHIASCAQCQHDIAEYERSFQSMDASLFRITCPSVETLTDYAEGKLAIFDRRAVEAHAQDCQYCAMEIRLTRDFLELTNADLPVRSNTTSQSAAISTERIGQGQLIRRLAYPLPATHAFNPAFPLMGSSEESGAFQIFQSDEITIHVHQETTDDGQSVTGLVQQIEDVAPGENALIARLIQEDVEVEALPDGGAMTADQGAIQCVVVRDAFEFESVQPGRYHLEIVFAAFIVVAGPITVELG